MRASPIRSSSGLKIDLVDRAEWLGRVSNAFDQLFVAARDCRRRAANAGRLRLLRRPSFFTEQRNKSHIGEIFAAIFVLRNPRHPHQFLGALVRAHRDHQPAADFQLVLQKSGTVGPPAATTIAS